MRWRHIWCLFFALGRPGEYIPQDGIVWDNGRYPVMGIGSFAYALNF
jgi:hypothetical protein